MRPTIILPRFFMIGLFVVRRHRWISEFWVHFVPSSVGPRWASKGLFEVSQGDLGGWTWVDGRVDARKNWKNHRKDGWNPTKKLLDTLKNRFGSGFTAFTTDGCILYTCFFFVMTLEFPSMKGFWGKCPRHVVFFIAFHMAKTEPTYCFWEVFALRICHIFHWSSRGVICCRIKAGFAISVEVFAHDIMGI